MTSTDRGDEFYIGYEPALPPGLARRVRGVVVIAALAVVTVALMVTRAQHPLADATFEYGHRTSWTGVLVRTPAPALLVPGADGYGRFWLVGRGKHGVEAALGVLPDGWVRVDGTLISRDPWRMIEAIAVVPAPGPANPPLLPPSVVGEGREVTLRGEVVDSKCFLGVMNPGERVVHRDCAIRCLSGGVPPMIAYRDPQGHPNLAVLVDAQGRPLHDAVHDVVGRPVDVRGRLFRLSGQSVFQLTPVSGVLP